MELENLADSVLFDREWFYPFQLPDGRVLPTRDGAGLHPVHSTRARMIDSVLDPEFPGGYDDASVIDLACHQGFFSCHMANKGCKSVLAVDARQAHVDDTGLIARAMQLPGITTRTSDIHKLNPEDEGRFDIVLMLGLIYHLENPIGAIRLAQALTQKVCLIETQVVPHLSGSVDWGSKQYVRPLKGWFGVIDELQETHAPEASTTGICLAPSLDGLIWIMHAVGFDQVGVVTPPADAYEQHRDGKRVMMIGLNDAK